ncbi:MAG: GPR endopeptidase [Oscillospiraceae bacterium]|jgi:spore protease|nr:GPR endopeptidase [Oscillospiraceae bacterium]
MIARRTDLAVEARELWEESAGETTRLPGVEARDYETRGCPVTAVRILSDEGARALGKPAGAYVTVELPRLIRGEPSAFADAARALAQELRPLLPLAPAAAVLVVGLGNRDITPDAVGPLAVEHVMVTRHLVDRLPDLFGHLRPVAAFAPGVLGSTGMESADIIRGVIAEARPDAVILVDALASRRLRRVCSTVQFADTGIVPGSGVGNARAALNRETLGLPAVAVGVPTVVDTATLCADLLEEAGAAAVDPAALAPHGGGMIVTPKEIDARVRELSKAVGYAINLCLQEDLSVEDVMDFLS